MIISIPLNTVIARFLKSLQEQQMKYRDKRTRLMSELLANVRSIKLYAWENAFIRRILAVRNGDEKESGEVGMMRRIAVFNVCASFPSDACSMLSELTVRICCDITGL